MITILSRRISMRDSSRSNRIFHRIDRSFGNISNGKSVSIVNEGITINAFAWKDREEILKKNLPFIPLSQPPHLDISSSTNPFEKKYLRNSSEQPDLSSFSSSQIAIWKLDVASRDDVVLEIWNDLNEKEKRDPLVFNAYLCSLFFSNAFNTIRRELEWAKENKIPLQLGSFEAAIAYYLNKKDVKNALEWYHNCNLKREEKESLWKMFTLYSARQLDKVKVDYWLDLIHSLDKRQNQRFYENVLVELSLDSHLFFTFHRKFRRILDPDFIPSLDESADVKDPFFAQIFFHYWHKRDVTIYSNLLSKLENSPQKDLVILGYKIHNMTNQVLDDRQTWLKEGQSTFREKYRRRRQKILWFWGNRLEEEGNLSEKVANSINNEH